MRPEDGKVIALAPRPAHGPEELAARSDCELMELASAGSTASLGEIVRRHRRHLRAFCASACGDRAAGDDMAQEVFMDLWRARARYKPSGQFRAYLYTLARNRCRTFHRRRPSAAPPPITEELPAIQLEAILADERGRRLDTAIAALTPKLRDAVLLRFRAELDYPEVARVLEKSEATVRSRIFLAVKALRQALDGGRE
jgi:RNA polymerase sigma-70 factor (ECF subfamily)